MESFYTSALFNCTNLKLVTNRKMIAVGLALVVTGILIYVPLLTGDCSAKWLQTVCIVCSVSAVFTGLTVIFNYRKKLIYKPTCSPVRHYQFYYDRCELSKLSVLLLSPMDLSDEFCLRPRNDGEVRLDILISDDGEFTVAQAFLMNDHVYYSFSRLIAFDSASTPSAVRYFRSCIDR